MSSRRTHSFEPHRLALPWLLAATLTLAALFAPTARILAQETTPQPTAALPAGTQPATLAAGTETPTGTPATPTPTHTPTLVPTATPTLTVLQARLMLAQTYLDGKDYARAAGLYAELAEQYRGNTAALTGLRAALDGRAAEWATVVAPTPAPAAVPEPAAPAATLGSALADKLREYGSIALAALFLVVALYLLANAIRWLLHTLRELWFTRGLPLLRRPAVRPGFLIGEFVNCLGDAGANAPRVISATLTEKLLLWNQLVQDKETPVMPEPTINLGGMDWLKVMWSWILPAPRGYKVTGALFQTPRGAYQLAIQRTALARNSVDRSTTLERADMSPEAAFRWMAGEAAKWLVNPADMEASEAVARGMRSIRGAEGGLALTPSEIFDEAVALLLPVRQQVKQGAIDFNEARRRLQEAQGLLDQLPDGSELRQDLAGVIADLRRSVPGG